MRTTGGIPFDALPVSTPVEPASRAEDGLEDDSSPLKSPDEIKVYRAIKFLEEVLAHGPLPSAWVIEEGKRQGHTERTLRRARRKRNVRALKAPRFERGGLWYMALSDDPAVALFKSRRREDRQAALQRIQESVEQFQARDSPEAIRVG